jgi:membrane fusion protein, multidrug efflux system
MTSRHAIALALAATLAAAGCRSSAAPASEESGGEGRALSQVMVVSAARVRTEPMRSELRLLGTTVARRHITLRAPAAGRVIGLALQSGDHVHRGEVVAHIINRETEAAQLGLEVARKLDPAEAPEIAKSVQRYASGSGIAVRAPEGAIVDKRLVSSGQMVDNLEPLVDMIDPSSVYVDAAVPIDDIRLIKPGMSGVVTSELRPGVEIPAKVAALSPTFDPNSATAPARVEFTGATRIDQAGAAVEVRVTTAFSPEAIVIPVAALFHDAETGGFYVFVVGSGDIARRTTISLGIRTLEMVQVIAGLKVGDLVITSGGYALSDGLKVHPLIAQN